MSLKDRAVEKYAAANLKAIQGGKSAKSGPAPHSQEASGRRQAWRESTGHPVRVAGKTRENYIPVADQKDLARDGKMSRKAQKREMREVKHEFTPRFYNSLFSPAEPKPKLSIVKKSSAIHHEKTAGIRDLLGRGRDLGVRAGQGLLGAGQRLGSGIKRRGANMWEDWNNLSEGERQQLMRGATMAAGLGTLGYIASQTAGV